MRRRILVAVALSFALIGAVLAQTLPLTGRIVDRANLLPATVEADLSARLSAHESRTGEQVVVVTLPSLDGRPIEDVALNLARQWGIGTAENDDGALLLIARDERKLRIEVGYGLEDRLTDAQSALIIRRRMVPLFRQNNFAGGIDAGVAGILDVLGGKAEAAPTSRQQRPVSAPFDAILLGLFALFFVVPIVMSMLTRTFGRKIAPGHYRWLGMDSRTGKAAGKRRRRGGPVIWGGGFGGRGGGFGGGGFSGGGGGFGGGGASGGW